MRFQLLFDLSVSFHGERDKAGQKENGDQKDDHRTNVVEAFLTVFVLLTYVADKQNFGQFTFDLFVNRFRDLM